MVRPLQLARRESAQFVMSMRLTVEFNSDNT